MENREKDGSITIKALKEIAKALDMQLVYGFVPNDGFIRNFGRKTSHGTGHRNCIAYIEYHETGRPGK